MEIRLLETGTPEYEQMAELRMRVLLDPIGVPRSYINPEREKNDRLIGAFENDHLVGCCILSHVDNHTLQLRQMAVDTGLQKKGVGAAIIAFAENIAKEKGYTVLMMHARDAVLDFYRKCGYSIQGEQFFEVGIGHHRMQKQLL
jgi:predicted GNAT family N-acyltransferase